MEESNKEYLTNASAFLAQIQNSNVVNVNDSSPSLYYYNQYKTQPTPAQQSFPYNPQYQLRPIDTGYRQTTLNNDNGWTYFIIF